MKKTITPTRTGFRLAIAFIALLTLLQVSLAQAQTITTGSISGSTFCPGATVTVSFTHTGTYKSANVFKAELSDAAGNYTTFTTLATTSKTSPITTTIPATAAPGTVYRIRVVSTSPVVDGSDNGSNLTIYSSASCGANWSITGNSDISTSNFIGTLVNAPLNIGTNGVQRAVIDVSGNVGIGTTTPAYLLDVKGNTNLNGNAYINNLLGIGTTAPAVKLDVENGTTSPAFKLVDGTQAAGNVLTSDSSGNASWQPSNSGWSLTGNVGTNPSINFIGTTDYVALSFRVANQNAGIIDFFSENTALGITSLASNISGYFNTAIGGGALVNNTSGTCNTANGVSSLVESNGSGNTANGFNALDKNVTGNYNTALGYYAGVSNGSDSNATAIGANAVVSESNALVLGNNANVGIGTSSPAVKLDVENGSASPAFKLVDGTQAAGNVLTSDGNGNASWAKSDLSTLAASAVPDFAGAGTIGLATTGNQPSSVVVSGNFAYVVDLGGNDLRVYDISNPMLPVLKNTGGTSTGSNPYFVTVSGNFAYVVDLGGNDLRVYDISNPAAPAWKNTGVTSTGANPVSVAVSGNFAYVVDEGGKDLRVYDVSNPAAPVWKNTGGTSTGTEPYSVAVSGNFAYVVDLNSSDLRVYDVSNPAAPVWKNTGGTSTGANPVSVAVSGNFAYVVDLSGNDLRVYDVSNPSVPVWKNTGMTSTGTNPSSITVSGNFAYVVDETSNDLRVYDVSNPSVPVLKNTGGTSTGAEPSGVAVSGNFAYVVDQNNNDLRVIILVPNSTLSINPVTGAVSTTTTPPDQWITAGSNIYNSNVGSVGIGTASPWPVQNGAEILQVSATQLPQYILEATSATLNNKEWRMIANSNNNAFQIQALNDTLGNAKTAFEIDRSGDSITQVVFPGGHIGIGTTSPAHLLQLSTDDAAKPGTNTWTIASDERLKTGVRPFNDGLSVINKINPVSFHYNGMAGMPTEKEYVGVLAQDVQAVAPYMVGKWNYQNPQGSNEEYLSYDGNAMTYIIINALKELKLDNDSLRSELARLLNGASNNSNSSAGSSDMNNGTATISINAAANTPLLGQNIPNPAANNTIIPFRIPKNCNSASIVISEVGSGKIVTAIAVSCDETNISLDAGSLASGSYTYSLYIDGAIVDSKQMILAK